MSETRLQDEYNAALRTCDIFVRLSSFYKTGRYTEEEFNVAHQLFKDTGNPLIYTFRIAPVPMGSVGTEVRSLLDFKERLSLLGHFYTGYDSVEHLKSRLRSARQIALG